LKQEFFLQTECPSCHPTNSVKALKDNSVSDYRQHAATMLPKQVRDTVMVAWAALSSDFKGVSE